MLRFPMFRPRLRLLRPVLGCVCSSGPLSPCLSPLPPVTSHQSQITKSFTIRTSEKHAPNPFGIRTSKTQDLKPFRMNTYEKRGRGPAIVDQITADQPRHLKKFGRTHQSHSRAFASSFLGVLLDEKSFSKLIPAHERLRGAESIEQILNFAVLVNLLGRTKYVSRDDLQGV